MNDESANRQIQAMISFIMQEAQEKQDDIKRDTEKEFQSEKQIKERQLTTAIKEDYARKKKEKVIGKRIEKSRKVSEARFAKMREREIIMKKLKEEVLQKLADVSKNSKYPELIRYLIVQSLMTLAENKVVLQCRSEDAAIVKKELPIAVKMYQDIVQQNAGVAVKCQVDLSNDSLPPAPSAQRKGLSCCGGVVVSARNGAILCKNTLDSRLDLCFENLIPQLRGMLFGIREKPPQQEQEKKEHGQ